MKAEIKVLTVLAILCMLAALVLGRERATVTGFFRWYDLWLGAYVDTKNRTLYICPVPMFGVKLQLLTLE